MYLSSNAGETTIDITHILSVCKSVGLINVSLLLLCSASSCVTSDSTGMSFNEAIESIAEAEAVIDIK
jgi:hypothetical protein